MNIIDNKSKKVLKKISITMIIISLLLIIIGSLYFSFNISSFILPSIVIVIGLMWSIYGTVSLIKNFKQNTKSKNNNDTEPEVNVNNEDISKIKVRKKNINRKNKEIFRIISLIIIVLGLIFILIGTLVLTKEFGGEDFSSFIYYFVGVMFLRLALVIGLMWSIYGLALLIKQPILETIWLIVIIARSFICYMWYYIIYVFW